MKDNTMLGLPDEGKLTVQKSIPLLSLWKSELSLAEFKILDVYLARINSHEPERREVVFEAGELERVLGVTRINKPDLKARLKHLMGNVVEVTSDHDVDMITLFEEAKATRNELGLWEVRMECTQKAMKYFFNIESIGYLRYKLRCITSITSRYSYVMFIYLESNRFRKSWDVELGEIKEILGCDSPTYEEFKNFNRLILKRVQKDLNEKTECHYTYEPIKHGRFVTKIRFTLETLKDLPDNGKMEEIEELPAITDGEELVGIEHIKKVLAPLKPTEAEVNEVVALLPLVDEGKIPEHRDGREAAEYLYLNAKVRDVIRRDEMKKIKNKMAYLITMVKKDMGQ